MNIVRNILAVVVGFIVGNLVNLAVLTVGHRLMPPPAGFDGTSLEGVASTIHLLAPADYIAPFLAHALGPFVGVLVAMFVAASGRRVIAIVLALLFLAGGVYANYMIPAPMWYRILDVGLAYIPTAWLAYMIAGRSREVRV